MSRYLGVSGTLFLKQCLSTAAATWGLVQIELMCCRPFRTLCMQRLAGWHLARLSSYTVTEGPAHPPTLPTP